MNPAPRAVKSIKNKGIEFGAGFGVGLQNLTHTLHQLYNQQKTKGNPKCKTTPKKPT